MLLAARYPARLLIDCFSASRLCTNLFCSTIYQRHMKIIELTITENPWNWLNNSDNLKRYNIEKARHKKRTEKIAVHLSDLLKISTGYTFVIVPSCRHDNQAIVWLTLDRSREPVIIMSLFGWQGAWSAWWLWHCLVDRSMEPVIIMLLFGWQEHGACDNHVIVWLIGAWSLW